MKKISNISVSSKGIMTRKYFKIFVIILLILMIAMSAVLIKVYVDINKKEAEKESSAKNIIESIDKSLGEYKIFEDEKGLLGVTGKDNRTVIEPYWNDIYVLSEKRFIVSRMFGKEKKMGIIDNESNILVPFIFETFKSFSNEFIGGFTGEKNNFFLFDKNGGILSDKMWTGYKYSDKIIFLNDGNNEYRGKINDGIFNFVYVELESVVDNKALKLSITDQKKIEDIGIDDINRIFYITNKYLEYLIKGNNENDISDITSEQYSSSLLSNDFFRDCRIKKISNYDIDFSGDGSSASYDIKMIVNYDYSKKDVNLKNISSEIIFNIVKNENNRLILKSINKTEL